VAGLLATGLLAGLATTAAAQAPASPRIGPGLRLPATLHQAWLAEVMDLDGRRAVELYTEVARDRQPENHERWLAVARLLELHRLGQTSAPALDPIEVPNALRGPFAAAATTNPANHAALEARAAALLGGSAIEPAPAPGTPPPAPTEPPRLPVLRPVVHDAETWLLGLSGLSWRDRLRQRQPQGFDRSQFTDRYNALRVMTAELDGRRSQADEVRALYFTQWRPPALDGTPAVLLERVRRNLAAMQQERSQASPLLPRLAEALDRAANDDPLTALQLVQRLPLFAELLLANGAAERTGPPSGTAARELPGGGTGAPGEPPAGRGNR
jgi:hypothetical protein